MIQEKGPRTRTWSDFPSKAKAWEGVVSLYETRLKELNPGVTNITCERRAGCQAGACGRRDEASPARVCAGSA